MICYEVHGSVILLFTRNLVWPELGDRAKQEKEQWKFLRIHHSFAAVTVMDSEKDVIGNFLRKKGPIVHPANYWDMHQFQFSEWYYWHNSKLLVN